MNSEYTYSSIFSHTYICKSKAYLLHILYVINMSYMCISYIKEIWSIRSDGLVKPQTGGLIFWSTFKSDLFSYVGIIFEMVYPSAMPLSRIHSKLFNTRVSGECISCSKSYPLCSLVEWSCSCRSWGRNFCVCMERRDRRWVLVVHRKGCLFWRLDSHIGMYYVVLSYIYWTWQYMRLWT